VPNHGFQWIEGRSGSDNTERRFLIPRSANGTTREIPADLYLTFAELKPTLEAALEFANRYGSLGLVKRHFHSEQTEVQFAECWVDWRQEMKDFKTCLDAWRAVDNLDRRGLEYLMRDHYWRVLVKSDGPFLTARLNIMGHINARMNPQPVLPDACLRKTCTPQVVGGISPFVTYMLNFQRSDKPTLNTTPIVPRLVPTALSSAIWLQLAELVTGSRVMRQCEKCHKFMDITDSPRKGAKRMHDKCSLESRMSRYRLKKRLSS
jgi:hypothetical protein